MNNTRGTGKTPVIRYRRSPALVAYWSGSDLVCFNPSGPRRLRVEPDMLAFLDQLESWRSARDLARKVPSLGAADTVSRLLKEMESLGLVESSRRPREWPWAKWSPEAAFFHFGTRDGKYPESPLPYHEFLAKRAVTDPPPPFTKSIKGRRIRMQKPAELGELSSALLARRTWRNFGAQPVSKGDLSTLLQLTWGVQKWAKVRGEGKVPLKTSPSGGARHSIEAYVLALNVEGLRPGAYHYDAATHELVVLKASVSPNVVTRLLANQFYYGATGAVIVMTAVFARAMWRYPFSRAFRSLLTEAGHLGQTFCVTATALKLAPFASMAFFEPEIERLIGIDGVNECALYVVGVGSRSTKFADQPGMLPSRGPQ